MERDRNFGNLLSDEILRKHKKLSFVTVYSHENIFYWLQGILPAWKIHVPENGVSALSEWPAEKSLNRKELVKKRKSRRSCRSHKRRL